MPIERVPSGGGVGDPPSVAWGGAVGLSCVVESP